MDLILVSNQEDHFPAEPIRVDSKLHESGTVEVLY